MVTLDEKNCIINVVSFDLDEITTPCYIWKGKQGPKLQNFLHEEGMCATLEL
jgi:hypothetical protein